MFQLLDHSRAQFISFEKALGIVSSYQNLESISPSKESSDLSNLQSPAVYNNINELYEEVDLNTQLNSPTSYIE